jgi:uncharacterized protein
MCPLSLQAIYGFLMARNFLKRLLPTSASIKSNPALHFLGDLLHDPNLFHFNRHSVSVAFFWGLFVATLPMPGQMPVAAAAALYFRCNLPIACSLVWVTNPFTMPVFFYVTYTVGRIILHFDPIVFVSPPEFTWAWITTELIDIWYPLLVPLVTGSIIVGLFLGTLGYFGMQLFWRWSVSRAWALRKKNRNVNT